MLLCEECELSKTRKNVVIYRGVENPNILFIGEAPGANEDFQGIPFCGRSGQLLDKWIKYMEIKNYGISNVVRCRPPNNRKPKPEEMKVCGLKLKELILEKNPVLLVSLGATPTSYLLELGKLTMLHFVGNIFNIKVQDKKYPMFVMYHPSYIIRTHRNIIHHLDELKKQFVSIYSTGKVYDGNK